MAPALRGTLDEVADEIIEEVRKVPAYARPLEGAFGRGIRAGVHEALGQFLGEIEATCTASWAGVSFTPGGVSTRC